MEPLSTEFDTVVPFPTMVSRSSEESTLLPEPIETLGPMVDALRTTSS